MLPTATRALLAAVVLAAGTSTTAAAGTCRPYGEIGRHWQATGAETGLLGPCLADEEPAPGGRSQRFRGGLVLWSPATGAHSIVGDIRSAYERLGGPAALGYPTTDETPTTEHVGAVSHLQGGSLYWSPRTGAHLVKGVVRDHWTALGAEASPLGFPTADERPVPGGARSEFTGGAMVWDARTGSTSIEWAPGPPPRYRGAAPVRAAFYYGWFPAWWRDPGSRFTPSEGPYSTQDLETVSRQVDQMRHGGLQAAIASWWGPETVPDDPADRGAATATTRSLRVGLRAAEGTPFTWGVYYEDEGYADPSVGRLRADLAYLRREFTRHPNFLRRDGRPVVFVWAEPEDDCSMVERWRRAARGFYVVHKIFPGWDRCVADADAWHQYAPAHSAISAAAPWSFSVSPGFHHHAEPEPRLPRDRAGFDRAVRAMKASRTRWQLVTTWNEWGEGTPVEPGLEWATPSGYGWAVDSLHGHYGRF